MFATKTQKHKGSLRKNNYKNFVVLGVLRAFVAKGESCHEDTKAQRITKKNNYKNFVVLGVLRAFVAKGESCHEGTKAQRITKKK